VLILEENTMKVLIRLIVSFFVFVVDVIYGNRSYARFYVLETIARVPYFSYVSVLHLYETLGWWRKADLLKVHFAETWNELHHLLIMESLGGDRYWGDRFLAQHIGVGLLLGCRAALYVVS
jgi:ubiquinol oxidase